MNPLAGLLVLGFLGWLFYDWVVEAKRNDAKLTQDERDISERIYDDNYDQ